ncbi:UDP-N-acetylglucosamine 2-epimerase (non-hydrolyzing) [Pseudomonadales bacterium]|nr:UDP-N-acetylglucosamine 2-epimerase (non-hydrolyzing) [Pseudomonadales bacterium]
MKILTIIGARPQFIKAAMVSKALSEAGFEEVIAHTGQHYDADMSDIFFEELRLARPQFNLGIGGGSHGQNTGRMIEALEGIIIDQAPDWVLVYGDTDSTLAGTLAAIKLHVPIAHVESGLRSFNRKMPEEINRILTDHAATLLLAPTELAVRNLSKEGIKGEKVKCVGDVMYDAALFFAEVARTKSTLLDRLGVNPNSYTLATIHRAENTDNPVRLELIFRGFAAFLKPMFLPLHPRTKSRLSKFGIKIPENVTVIDPVGYLDMVELESNACLIATDSGGVQKEAFFHKVPCVTLRDETEWIELIESGWNRLVPLENANDIADVMAQSIGTVGESISPYGNGDAGKLVASALVS